MSENKDDVLKKLAHMETLEKFLCGEAQMAKTWFGDKHPSKVGLFWWRTVLRKRFADVAALIRSQSSTIESLTKETQVTREALNTLTTATATLALGHEEGDERAVIRNILVGIESLRRELDAVRRDGERYRWLRKQMPADAITIESTRPRPATRSLHLSEDEADSAIDAAISEARGRE